MLSIAQSGFTVNFPYLLDVQARHTAWVIAWALDTRHRASSRPPPRPKRHGSTPSSQRSAASAERAKSCTPGYYNREGQANAKTRQGSFFFGSPTEYADILDASRANGVTGGLRDVVDESPASPICAGRMLALTRRRSPRVVIIGAGFGGLAAAVALRRRGIDDLMIIERADGVGGTWRQNIYPGAACDIQSHLYSFSFAPNRSWSRTYAVSTGDPRPTWSRSPTTSTCAAT